MKSRLASLLPVAVPWGLLLVSGLLGVDFGRHWDERVHDANLRFALQNRTILQVRYTYPGVPHLLKTSAILPELVGGIVHGRPWESLSPDLVKLVDDPAFQLRSRRLFLVVSSFGVPWVYLVVLRWRRQWPEALAAACFFGFSWEMAYHMRFVAPDALMTQLTALTLLLLMAAYLTGDRQRARRYLFLAAGAAALSCATKYQLGLLVVPLLFAARARKTSPILVVGIFAATFIVTTPGAILDSGKFWDDVLGQASIYARQRDPVPGSQLYSYRIAPGPAHLLRSIDYLALTLPSHTPAVAAAFTGLALLGVIAIAKESRRTALLLASFPILYLGYMSLQRIMVVRNLLPLAPFFAVAAARGVAVVFARSLALRTAFVSSLAIALAINAYWLFFTAGTIRERHGDLFVKELAYLMEGRPESHYLLSPRLRDEIQKIRGSIPSNATLDPTAADHVAVDSFEALDPNAWPGNHRQPEIRRLGPLPINFDYYPNWSGDPVIVVMPMAKARALGIRLLARAGP